MWFLLYIIVFVLILSEIQFRWKYRSLNRIPGPIDLPFIGLMLYFYDETKYLNNIFKLVRSYGSILKCSMIRQMYILTTDAEMVEFFLHSPKVTKKSENYEFVEPWLMKGMFNSDGEEYKNTRKMMTPAFHLSILKDYVIMVQSHCDVLMDILRKDVDSNCPIDIYPMIVNFTLDAIAEMSMGVKTNMLRNNSNQEYMNAMHFMTRVLIERSLSIWKRYDLLYRFSSDYVKQQKCLKILKDFTCKAIEQRQSFLLKDSTTQSSKLLDSDLDEKKKHSIFLDILLTSTFNGKPVTNDKIISEINTVLFGGHDTTGSTISLMMYQLSKNKIVQDKIVEELKLIYGNDRDRPVTMEDVNEMRYMDLVIKEVLRFYGIVPLLGREVIEDVEFKGTIIPKGTTIVLFLYGLHKSPTIYENPDEFIPERFETTDFAKSCSYVPFSAGSRNCIGKRFALYEIKITFAKLLRHFELESAGPDYKVELFPEMVMKPKNGLHMKIKSRDF